MGTLLRGAAVAVWFVPRVGAGCVRPRVLEPRFVGGVGGATFGTDGGGGLVGVICSATRTVALLSPLPIDEAAMPRPATTPSKAATVPSRIRGQSEPARPVLSGGRCATGAGAAATGSGAGSSSNDLDVSDAPAWVSGCTCVLGAETGASGMTRSPASDASAGADAPLRAAYVSHGGSGSC